MSASNASRPQFYEGQYLGAADLDAAVRYAREAQARHALAGHSWGIATGLELKEVDSPAGNGEVDVFITPGFAWDGFGRAVAVLSPYRLPLTAFRSLEQADAVMVWLRYQETESRPPAEGFAGCDEERRFSRVREHFEVVVGPHDLSRQRDPVLLGGDRVDARHALLHWDTTDPPIRDTSVPQQTLGAVTAKSRWLIPLGYVQWAPGGVGGQGRLVGTRDPLWLRRSRASRIYCGAIAESVYAANGVIRLRARGATAAAEGVDGARPWESSGFSVDEDRDFTVDDQNRPQPVDLVWVEGALRAKGDIKLFDTKIDLRSADGDGGALWIRRKGDNVFDGQDLELVIGAAEEGDNRLVIGPVSGSDNAVKVRLVVRDDGRTGIGHGQPQTLLHLKAQEAPVLTLEHHGNEQPGGRIAFRQNTGRGADLYYDDTGGERGLKLDTLGAGGTKTRLAITPDGKVGIGATQPEHRLQIGDASDNASVALRGPGGDPQSSYLAFEDDGATAQRWFRIVHDSDSGRLTIRSNSRSSILSLGRTTGNIGVGTGAAQYALDIRRSLASKAFSVGLGGDEGRIWTDYTANSPTLVFYDKDDGGILRFRQSPDTDNEEVPQYEAVIAGRQGRIGINTTNPRSELEVNGDVRLGAAGALFALAGAGNWRVLIGDVASGGNVLNGTGFSASRSGTGTYRVNFSSPFSGTPVVVVTAVDTQGTDNVLTVKSVSGGGFDVHSRDVSKDIEGDLQNTRFTFIAIGGR